MASVPQRVPSPVEPWEEVGFRCRAGPEALEGALAGLVGDLQTDPGGAVRFFQIAGEAGDSKKEKGDSRKLVENKWKDLAKSKNLSESFGYGIPGGFISPCEKKKKKHSNP